MNKEMTALVSVSENAGFADGIVAKLRQLYPEADIRQGPWIGETGQTMPAELMKGVRILYCELPPGNFDEFDRLEWVHLTSAGYAQVLDLPILERGIRVSNCRGIYDIPIAEWIIMMILMWQRSMPAQMANQQNKIWDQSPDFQTELRGSVVGFYGYGGVARQAARIAQTLGLTVWTLTVDGALEDRSLMYSVEGIGDPEGEYPAKVFSPLQKQEFLGGLDYLVISLPLTKTTAGIIGKEELRMLKSSAVLLNPARAAIIDEQAYVRCLSEGWIRGSSLDVHYAYPLPPDHPLWSLDNIIMTPHISGSNYTRTFAQRQCDILLKNIERFLSGRPLLSALTDAELRGE